MHKCILFFFLTGSNFGLLWNYYLNTISNPHLVFYCIISLSHFFCFLFLFLLLLFLQKKRKLIWFFLIRSSLLPIKPFNKSQNKILIWFFVFRVHFLIKITFIFLIPILETTISCRKLNLSCKVQTLKMNLRYSNFD